METQQTPPAGQSVDVAQLLATIGELEMTRRLLHERLSIAEQRIAELTSASNGDGGK